MTHLRLVKTGKQQPHEASTNTAVSAPIAGERYWFSREVAQQLGSDAVIGDYIISTRKGAISPVREESSGVASGYFWHNDLSSQEIQDLYIRDTQQNSFDDESGILTNRAILQSSKLIGPNIITTRGRPMLSVSPEFIIHFHTAAADAQLGEIRMVDTSRFITLESGKTIPVICTDPAEGQALFLQSGQTSPVKTQEFIQPAHSNETYVIRRSVNQYLPNEFQGEPVACITVLEHMTSYFMQKICSSTQGIWTPILAPISWAWNVRAEKIDGAWHLTKRKVLKPTSHQDGLELPLWRTHVEEQSPKEWQHFLTHRNPAFVKENTKNQTAIETL